VKETRAPRGDGLETHLLEVGLTVPLPVPPGVRVPVQGEHQGAHRIGDTLPALRPLVGRQTHPRDDRPAEPRLRISTLCIGLLSDVARNEGIAVACFPGLHRCGG
jgi:hypothetical protein